MINDIKERLQKVVGSPWKFNQKHEMFIGTTNAIEMYDRMLDLGRDSKEWIPVDDEMTKGYVLSPSSVRSLETTKSLGEFLANCREDMSYLLSVEDRLNGLIGKYGRPTSIDFFGDSWRIWFQDWHIHAGKGRMSYGGFSGEGKTLHEAMDRAESKAANYPPVNSFHCNRNCPDYDDSCY